MYDKMGNITYLERWLSSSKIDALEIQHIGNQIQNIFPKKPITGFNYDFDSMPYPNLSNKIIEYYYDSNGNLITNLDKVVAAIQYNFLNLPERNW